MNKNYIKSLINTMFDENVLNSEEDREYMKELLFGEGYQHNLTGNFDEDLEEMKAIWAENTAMDEEEEEGTEEDPTQNIDEICASLKIGFNFVPGIGVGYCSNEEDLEAMRNFVRGGMAVHELMSQIFG